MATQVRPSIRSRSRTRQRALAQKTAPLPTDPLVEKVVRGIATLGARKEVTPADLERLHIYWAALFFGTLDRIYHHDRRLHLRLQLELKRFGQLDSSEVIAGGERLLKFLPPPSSAFSKHPTDAILELASAFRSASPSLPSLRGKVRGDRLGPPLERILFTYYEYLTKERKRPRRRAARGEQAPHERAIEGARKKLGYTSVATFRKDLERARATYPDLVGLLREHGITMIKSD